MSGWGVIEWDSALRIIEVVALVVMAICMLYLRANFATRKEVAAIGSKVGEVAGRLDMVEHDLAKVPSSDVIADLRKDFAMMVGANNVVREQIGGLRQSFEGMAKAVGRIEDILMERGK